ncbi:NLPA lipoprotein [Alkaliphilus metalliredigens QYMF]|uniref:Lipoprotein n=1 Tax=Alkaliphilus metalliredigens (strain QYMF) TaxID=293826 RepID=A6TLT2_ALKMQ|nr:MetQ/NlpA family ABC transporter substrate-binding protein [Alkaliphilus metalliredigens]ABR47150.1 NLPA lipoprotein [Alkaliphilus metalliredigens QYMF]
MKKRLFLSIIGLLLITLIVGCTTKAKDEVVSTDEAPETVKLRVGATPVPHSEILNFIKPILLDMGVDLEIVEFTDYTTPNLALHDGEIDANFFQHVPYMETFAENNNIQLKDVAKTHVEPLGLYSKKVDSLEALQDGATIAIPNDPTNGGRALLLLANYGVIQLDDDTDLLATEHDISENPKNFKFIALEAPQIPRSLDDVDAAIINTNYALEASLNPVNDSLLLEDSNSPYANIVTIVPGNESEEKIQKLVEVLTSSAVRDFIQSEYKGAIVPAF